VEEPLDRCELAFAADDLAHCRGIIGTPVEPVQRVRR
jgi:hypothetical protein